MKNIKEKDMDTRLILNIFKAVSYLGPHTAVLEREKRGDTQVVDDLDQCAKDHDYYYLKEKTEYEKDHDKQKHMANIWKADDDFVKKILIIQKMNL